MKQILTLFIALFFLTNSAAQIASQQKLAGKLKKIEKSDFEHFKTTTTIFILSNIFDKEQYEKLLSEYWTVTPYKIVNINDFNRLDYMTPEYSFAELQAYALSKQKAGMQVFVKSIIAVIDVYFIQTDKIESAKTALAKLNPSKKRYYEKSRKKIASKKTHLSDIFFSPNGELLIQLYKGNPDDINLFEDDLFVNYSLGYLKNYFQKVNELITNNESYWLYAKDYLPELKNLKTNALYISEYQKMTIDGRKPGKFEALISNYKYKHQLISEKDLDLKILSGEEFYYLNYTRINSGDRIMNIINAKTGEIVLRHHMNPGMKFSLSKKQIDYLNKSLKSL